MLWILLIIGLLALAVAAGYQYGKGGRKQVQATATLATGRARGWLGRLRKPKPGPEQYRQWLAEAPLKDRKKLYQGLPKNAQAFQAWVAGLSPQEAQALGQRVSRFASGFGVDPAWLSSPDLDGDPELKEALEDAVALYGLADWRASAVQPDLAAFAAFEAWQAKPAKHKKMGEALFVHLVDQGAIEVPTDLYTAKPRQQRAYMEQAIRDLAEKDKPALYAALKEILFGTAEEVAPAEKPRSRRSRKAQAEAEPAPEPATG